MFCVTTSPQFPAVCAKAQPCSISITLKTLDADTDANFVMTGSGNIVEIQATAEKIPFSEDQFAALLALARKGIEKLVRAIRSLKSRAQATT